GAAAIAARAHGLRPDRARPRYRAARGPAGHGDAQRPGVEGRHSGRDRERRRGAGDLHGSKPTTSGRDTPLTPILEIGSLDVHYGRAHALQGVSLSLEKGILAVVGRNGMGKTTLCNAITGLVRATGSVKLAGEEILGLAPNVITDKGIGYVPQ